MKTLLFPVLILSLGLSSPAIRAAVVINEIFYHAPREIEDLEYIELYNSSSTSQSLNTWKLSGGISLTFPNVSIASSNFMVIAAPLQPFIRYFLL